MTAWDSSRTALRLGPLLVAGLVLASGCTDARPEGTFLDPELAGGELRLVSFDSCEEASRRLRDAALDYVGPWGFGTLGVEMAVDDAAAGNQAGDAAAPPPAAAERAAPGFAAPEGAEPAPPGGTAPSDSHSGTNVHEAGVDEPDLVKTDGRSIVTVSRGVLRVVDVARGLETGTLNLGPHAAGGFAPPGWQPADLLLHGDRALVLMDGGWDGGVMPGPAERVAPGGGAPGGTGSEGAAVTPVQPIAGPRLLLVELSAAPRVLSEYTVDGGLVDARAVGATARVVVRSGPRLTFPQLDPSADPQERLAANRRAVEDADLADWLPRYQVVEAGTTTGGQVECTDLRRPAVYTGTSMLTVLTFDLATAALGDGSPVSVVADGDTVYSNGSSLYVAADQRWRVMAGGITDAGGILPMPGLDDRTEIFRFDTSQPGPPRYAAAGSVDGALVNQYAMSEWEGHLRVATTTAGTPDQPSASAVHVLAERDGALVETGSVGGLGKEERIYSVRFTGPVGYVVTFRETDPLYTLDLRDPAAPAVLGELKITGYSAYLHPLGDGRLVGVGQEADQQGVVQGTQVSLFDVSDLTDPRLQDTYHVRSASSEAEYDPHAFLWWPAARILVVPLGWAPGGSGALVLRVDGSALTELGTVSHPWTSADGPIRRSLVIGEHLWTLSEAGLQASSLASLETTAWVPFQPVG